MIDLIPVPDESNIKFNELIIRHYTVLPYHPTWQAMKDFVSDKSQRPDELWLLQHQPVYTKGVRCKEMPSSRGREIPTISVDRGGLMTYHGPGQLVIYCLIDLQRKKLNVKQVVNFLEQCVINLLEKYGVNSNRIEGAPGIYIGKKKIASVGLRVRNRKTYHGLSINFDMDLKPFEWINPCGFESLEVVQLKDIINQFSWEDSQKYLINELIHLFNYNHVIHVVHKELLSNLDRSKLSRSTVPTSIHSPS